MTIQTVLGQVKQIRTIPGEDTVAVLAEFERDVRHRGHSITTRQHPATQDCTIKCGDCGTSARIYHVDSEMVIFSDFGEEGQCPSRQMNVLSLMVDGSNG